MIKAGDILDNRYEILEKIGQGGMSYVFKAKDAKLDRVVAIKILKEECSHDEEFLKKFGNEARSAAKLSHPNIVQAYDAAEEGELHYIVMELVEGITLKNYIARKGVLSNKETIGISLQTAEGILAAHKSGIIHRDIKPQNMIISKDGKVKVADFGIARAVTQDTVNSAVVGSVHYIAPEQAQYGQTDERSDIYSLGICMYEMITGKLPFKGENTVNVVMAHISEAIVPPSVYNPDVYPALSDIILKATKKRPEDRYASAADLIADLKRCVNEPNGHFVKLYDTVENKKDASVAADRDRRDESADDIEKDTERTDDVPRVLPKPKEPGDTSEDSTGDTTVIITRDDYPPTDSETESFVRRYARYLIYGAMALMIIIAVILTLNISDRRTDVVIATTEAEEASVTDSSTEEAAEYRQDLTVEIRPEQVMPSILGNSVDEAVAKLSDLGVSLDSSESDFSDVYYEGLIIEQYPEAGETVEEGETAYVTVSLGTRINYTLGHLLGLSVEEAVTALNEVGVYVSADTTSRLSEDVEVGLVVGYELIEGTDSSSLVVEGSTVRLVVSSGPENVEIVMQSLLGYSEDQARYMLNQLGLSVGEVTYRSSALYNEGTVCSQSVEEGETVLTGEEIDLEISTGASEDEDELSQDFYYGSVDTVCRVGTASGPIDSMNMVYVYTRLRQRVNDSYVYTTLEEVKPVPQGSMIPVSIRNIRGAYGVDTGDVEVINANTGELYFRTTISFGPLE